MHHHVKQPTPGKPLQTDLSLNPMSILNKNEIPHPKFGCGEIIQTTSQQIPDSGQDKRKDQNTSSENSPDSCEDINSFQKSDLCKKRIKLKARSISDSTDDEFGSYPSPKGILKYGGNRRLRSLSESCAGNYISFSNNGESNSALDDWCEEDEIDEDEEEGEGQKVKKTVRFSNVVYKQLFRSNSTILGQRNKIIKENKRKPRYKPAKKNPNSTTSNGSPTLSSSVESDHAMSVDDRANKDNHADVNVELKEALESVTLCDSGIEVEDSDPGSNQQQGSNPKSKKNKKKNRVKNKRRRANSESSASEMIFDLDL